MVRVTSSHLWLIASSCFILSLSCYLAAAADVVLAVRPTTQPATQPSTQPAVKPFTPLAEMKDRFGGRGMPGQWEDYSAMHRHFVSIFVEREGFGSGRMIPEMLPRMSKTLYVDGTDYRIRTLDLVSLQKDDSPFVYITSAIPQTYLLPKSRHRPLTEDELAGLESLKAGREAVMLGKTEHLTLIGALRAESRCLRCHDVDEGTLLGAFVYALEPARLADLN